MRRTIAFTLNGAPASLSVDDDRALLWVLRSDLGLTGAKYGCGAGLCGACTVVVDGQAVRSCATRVGTIEGRSILTIEGLAAGDRPHPLQTAFEKETAFQCGFCTSGMILSAYALLLKTPRPTRDEVVRQMDDNLCRCGSHRRILQAVLSAAGAQPAAGGTGGGAR